MAHSFSERVVIEESAYHLFQEHLNRYIFAGQFVRQRRVLDIACGSGYGTDYLRREGAILVVGVDISWEACRQARSSYNVDVVVADATRLPFQDRSFEVVVSFETIEHLSEPHNFLEECLRSLQIGSKVIISTPNRYMSLLEKNPYHFREYRPQEFVNLLQLHFSRVQIYGQVYRSYLRHWVVYIITKVMCLVPIGRRLFSCTRERLFGKKIHQPKDPSVIDEIYKVTPMDNVKSKLVQPSFIVCIADVLQK